MKRIAAAATCGALALLPGCSDAGTAPDTEIAAELRALRAVLVQQQKSGAGAQPTVQGVADRTQITTALQPLREVLDGLAGSQRELQTRQITLTQEMQRWSQLLVETASGARQEEAKVMTQRLQQVEKALQEQDKRHREVEALMQGALERTADRLEDFLRRLEGTVRPERPPDPGNPESPAPIKNAAEPAPGSNGVPPASGTQMPAGGGDEENAPGSVAAARPARHWSVYWWMLPFVLAASLVTAFLLRLRRLSNRSFVAAVAAARTGPGPVESPLSRDLDGVQEIWAAAALLSEAVDRLKQNSESQVKPPPPKPTRPTPPPPATAAADGVDLAEVSVLGDDRGKRVVPPAPAAQEPAAAKPAPEPAATRPAPARAGLGSVSPPRTTAVRCRITGVTAQTQAELLRLLEDDPRVLRRPEPVLTATPTAVEVAFDVLPGLPASERSQIEQRLRDAVS